MLSNHDETDFRAESPERLGEEYEYLVTYMWERQVALGAHASIASITADMAILNTCFEPMQEKFTELEDEYPEHRVDDNGEALPP